MSCVRCEIARAKIVAGGMAGVGMSAEAILTKLVGWYGPAYYRSGRHVYRADEKGGPTVLICEARR